MSRSERILLAAGGSAAILAIAAGWVLLAPPAGEAALLDESVRPAAFGSPEAHASAVESGSADPAAIVVDVEGAVVKPGIRTLPAGARVADALTAAGGYAPDADLEAAAGTLNLAERLVDGAQIIVPRAGAGIAAAPSGTAPAAETSGAPEPGGVVNLNTATAEQLEALPGIGPVTVERILAGRAERPFASLEDALERGVLDRGQLRELEGLATAG